MSPKRGKHLRWREIMAFICRWQGCWGRGHGAGAGAYVHDKLLESECFLLMSRCGCINVVEQLLCLLSSGKNHPSTIGLRIPWSCIASQSLIWWGNSITLLFHREHPNGNHNILPIPSPNGTVARSILPEVCKHIYLCPFRADLRRF